MNGISAGLLGPHSELGKLKTGRVFFGCSNDCKGFLTQQVGWYVYILRSPDARPFYIGKGRGYRALEHEKEARQPSSRLSNPFKLNVIRSILGSGAGLLYEIDTLAETEAEALAREGLLIQSIRRLHEGGPLTNLDPGDGSLAGPAPFSKQRRSSTLAGEPFDNPARTLLNRFVLNIAPMKSVILKPVDQFTAHATRPYAGRSMRPSTRQATALVASAAANGVLLDSACVIPRLATVRGVPALIENGVASDIVTSGLASVLATAGPAEECFKLSPDQARRVVGLLGMRKCTDLGVVTRTAF